MAALKASSSSGTVGGFLGAGTFSGMGGGGIGGGGGDSAAARFIAAKNEEVFGPDGMAELPGRLSGFAGGSGFFFGGAAFFGLASQAHGTSSQKMQASTLDFMGLGEVERNTRVNVPLVLGVELLILAE